MRRRSNILIVVALALGGLGLTALVAIGGLGAATWLVAREGSELPAYRGPPDFVALGPGSALHLEGTGIGEGQVVRRVDLVGGTPLQLWRWQGPLGLGSYGWMWTRAGTHAVGELHPVQGDGAHRLAVFDHVLGHVGEVEGVLGGAWDLERDTLLVGTSDALVAYAVAGEVVERWRVALPPVRGAPLVGIAGDYAVLQDETLRVYGLSDGAPARVGIEGELVGLDAARGEVLTRSADGRITVTSLREATPRLSLDVAAGAAVVDGMRDPALVGTHAGHWILVYATELDHITSVNGQSWTRHAARTLVAVEPETGAVLWRTELGPFELDAPIWPRHLPSDTPLPDVLLVHGVTDVEGGGASRGHLAAVQLTDGALLYRVAYDGATRGNALFARIGEAAYLRVRTADDGARSALLRFSRGRFTGATWLPGLGNVREPALRGDEAWIPGDEGGWALARGPSLRAAARAPGTAAPGDARAFALERIAFPPAALTTSE